MRSLADSIQYAYAILLGRPMFSRLNRFVLCLGLRGLGYLNYWDFEISGERGFIRNNLKRSKKSRRAVIFDVGAHDGEYVKMCADVYKQERRDFVVHCFEPSRDSFIRLKERTSSLREIVTTNCALSSVSGTAQLFDLALGGTEHASLSKRAVKNLSQQEPEKQLVEVQTGDEYCKLNKIDYIDILKIDVEGFELEVLKGFSDMLKRGCIDAIQFELNITSLQERLRVGDFEELLEGYRLYRLLPGREIIEIEEKDIVVNTYQNIVCLPDRASVAESRRV